MIHLFLKHKFVILMINLFPKHKHLYFVPDTHKKQSFCLGNVIFVHQSSGFLP